MVMRLVATRTQMENSIKDMNAVIHNPLTKTGKKVLKSMEETYGKKKAKNVFYAMAHKKGKKWHK